MRTTIFALLVSLPGLAASAGDVSVSITRAERPIARQQYQFTSSFWIGAVPVEVDEGARSSPTPSFGPPPAPPAPTPRTTTLRTATSKPWMSFKVSRIGQNDDEEGE